MPTSWNVASPQSASAERTGGRILFDVRIDSAADVQRSAALDFAEGDIVFLVLAADGTNVSAITPQEDLSDFVTPLSQWVELPVHDRATTPFPGAVSLLLGALRRCGSMIGALALRFGTSRPPPTRSVLSRPPPQGEAVVTVCGSTACGGQRAGAKKGRCGPPPAPIGHSASRPSRIRSVGNRARITCSFSSNVVMGETLALIPSPSSRPRRLSGLRLTGGRIFGKLVWLPAASFRGRHLKNRNGVKE